MFMKAKKFESLTHVYYSYFESIKMILRNKKKTSEYLKLDKSRCRNIRRKENKENSLNDAELRKFSRIDCSHILNFNEYGSNIDKKLKN
ncbi:hypothetical protein BpHYR1_049041 [Brachionus plicatilis]|uniref:Uncharacterized protein n=1 Tax=Brachionus plicatilis TaxID=10195 RepID=A0A3M7S6I2_BRAPC|nr:hypothetical protein BpHYR1_049041 [Brachionus plicatilis]